MALVRPAPSEPVSSDLDPNAAVHVELGCFATDVTAATPESVCLVNLASSSCRLVQGPACPAPGTQQVLAEVPRPESASAAQDSRKWTARVLHAPNVSDRRRYKTSRQHAPRAVERGCCRLACLTRTLLSSHLQDSSRKPPLHALPAEHLQCRSKHQHFELYLRKRLHGPTRCVHRMRPGLVEGGSWQRRLREVPRRSRDGVALNLLDHASGGLSDC